MNERLKNLKDELKIALDRDDSEISIQSHRVAIEELERVLDAYEALSNHNRGLPEEVEQLREELAILHGRALRIEAERDAVVEMHKQIFKELMNGRNSDQTPQNPS
jgi:phosphate starvation-inducible protein PhoH